MSDLARQRLKEIRTLRGWREAYRVAGLTSEGSDATKRRRLSRLINRKTSGAKVLSSEESKKINRAYRYREKKGIFLDERVKREVKVINQTRASARRNARKVFGSRGTNPNPTRLQSRLRQNADLTEADIQRIREAFERAEEDSGRSIRLEYRNLLAKVNITSLPPVQRKDFRRRLKKAEDAVERDTVQTRLEV